MPESQEKLRHYLALLQKWQKSINLVSNATLDEAWSRHFEDSLQLADLIPAMVSSRRKPGSFGSEEAEEDPGFRRDDIRTVLFDLGSGAGFPGMVLAIARPDLDVTLIESDTKKCTFLSTVSRETKTPVTILNQRIEDVSRETIPDIITARALAPLDKLLEYCLPWALYNESLTLLFLKGEKAAAETEQARQCFSFDVKNFPVKTGQGVILKITDLTAL